MLRVYWKSTVNVLQELVIMCYHIINNHDGICSTFKMFKKYTGNNLRGALAMEQRPQGKIKCSDRWVAKGNTLIDISFYHLAAR